MARPSVLTVLTLIVSSSTRETGGLSM
jgi:hypothetical protein